MARHGRGCVMLAGRYEILEKIGSGGMGEGFKASDAVLKRPVAIKLLRFRSPDLTERLKKEAQAAALLNHPNILTVYDVGQVEESPFIVMEWVAGGPLADQLRQVPPIEWPRFLPLLAQ